MKNVLKFFLLIFSSYSCFAMKQENTWHPWDAELYDQHSKPQYEASLKSLSQFNLSSPDFKVIVELGCNTANVSHELAQRHTDKTFVGIDPQLEAINIGKKKHASNKNLTLICDSAQKYKLQNHNIPLASLIGCYHVLHWIPQNDVQLAFDNIAANLDNNGIVDVITSAKQEESPLTKAILWTIIKPTWWGLLPYCLYYALMGQNSLTLLSASELAKIAIQAGLKIDRCEEINTCVNFSSKNEFKPWLHSILKPYGIEAISEEQQKKFVDDAADLYCEHYNPGKNEAIEYRFKEVHLTAHKSS